jgi:light-regulated signal transduction histidine kinase (bacteriophytochrome)
LLRSIVEVKIIYENNKSQPPQEVEVRAFHNVSVKVSEEITIPVYSPSDNVFSDADLYMQVIQKALKEARAWSERYSIYVELAEIREVIDKVTEVFNNKA